MNHFNLVLKVVIALRTLLNVLDSLRQAIDRSQESVLILLDIASILQILLFSLKTLQCKNVKFTILLVYLIQLQTDVDPIFLTIPSSFSLVAFTLTSSLFGIEILKAQGFVLSAFVSISNLLDCSLRFRFVFTLMMPKYTYISCSSLFFVETVIIIINCYIIITKGFSSSYLKLIMTKLKPFY